MSILKNPSPYCPSCCSMSEYSSHTHSGDSSVNDSGVVGDHDQDSLYDLTVNNIEGNIINCKEKLDAQPSKIDIPFVVSIGLSSPLYFSPVLTQHFSLQSRAVTGTVPAASPAVFTTPVGSKCRIFSTSSSMKQSSTSSSPSASFSTPSFLPSNTTA